MALADAKRGCRVLMHAQIRHTRFKTVEML